jgi:hypothetical protein
MAKAKTPRVRILRVKKGDTLKTLYAKMRRAFTAADLQRYTEIEEGIPARDVLAGLRALDREAAKNKKRKPRNGRAK